MESHCGFSRGMPDQNDVPTEKTLADLKTLTEEIMPKVNAG